MENTPPDTLSAVAGKWHEPEYPVRNAAYRLCYLMMFQRYTPDAVLYSLNEVFVASGLLTSEDCSRVLKVAVGFARMPVEGNG